MGIAFPGSPRPCRLFWGFGTLGASAYFAFNEETCTRVDVDCTFVMAVMEMLFLGHLDVLADKTFRGSRLSELLGQA